MKPEEIHLNDFQRIFFGEVPAVFFIEIILRTAFIYVVLMFSMRLMGQRMSSQLGRNELAAMVSLAAAVGVPLQAPDRGLLPVVIIAIIIIGFQRLIAYMTSRSEIFEQITEDNLSILINNGVLDLAEMKETGIAKQRLFAELRCSGIIQLGMVKSLYLEANGSFTLIRNPEEIPGLPILPSWDSEYKRTKERSTDRLVCEKCGYCEDDIDVEEHSCFNCKSKRWIKAVLTVQEV